MSIPPLGGDKACRPGTSAPHPLRKADSLVAAPADGYQIPLPCPVTVGVIPTESEPRKLFNMANMVHKLGSIDFSANLAIPMIF